MKQTLEGIQGIQQCPYLHINFDAMIGTKKYNFQTPIQTLHPDWDFQLLMTPYKDDKLDYDKSCIRYFKDDFVFNVVE